MQNESTYFIFELYTIHIYWSDKFIWRKLRANILAAVFLFLNVSQFALNVLCLPNSNAPSERIWSYYNREMTRFSASLAFKTMLGILLSSQYIKDVGGLMFF